MNREAQFGVVIPAAGSGSRYGGGDKLLVDLGGRTVLQRSVRLFATRADVAAIVIVTGRERMESYRGLLENEFSQEGVELAIVEGGKERWESVLFGLRQLSRMGGKTGVPVWVAVHDAARPLTPVAVIDEAFDVTKEKGAALPCIAEPATLKRRGPDGTVSKTVDRRDLFQAQTPQCFELARLLAGYEQLVGAEQIHDVTDDAQIYERMGGAVPITGGSQLNLKITTAEDVELARRIAAFAEQDVRREVGRANIASDSESGASKGGRGGGQLI